MESEIIFDDVISRMLEVSGCSDKGALSEYFGHKRNALASAKSRHKQNGGMVGIPFREAAALASEKNVSLDWLIFGKPGEAADEIQQQPPAAPAAAGSQAALERIRAIVLGVEEALAATRRTIPPEKKADLIAALVEIYDETEAEPSRNNILQLVRSAS